MCVCVRERERKEREVGGGREGERETNRVRQTHTEIDRKTERRQGISKNKNIFIFVCRRSIRSVEVLHKKMG